MKLATQRAAYSYVKTNNQVRAYKEITTAIYFLYVPFLCTIQIVFS